MKWRSKARDVAVVSMSISYPYSHLHACQERRDMDTSNSLKKTPKHFVHDWRFAWYDKGR
jgi:hypothetical protein